MATRMKPPFALMVVRRHLLVKICEAFASALR